MKYSFNVTSTLEVLEADFDKARKEMSEWEWTHGGYECLYTSQKRRLLKEIDARNAQIKSRSNSKK